MDANFFADWSFNDFAGFTFDSPPIIPTLSDYNPVLPLGDDFFNFISPAGIREDCNTNDAADEDHNDGKALDTDDDWLYESEDPDEDIDEPFDPAPRPPTSMLDAVFQHLKTGTEAASTDIARIASKLPDDVKRRILAAEDPSRLTVQSPPPVPMAPMSTPPEPEGPGPYPWSRTVGGRKKRKSRAKPKTEKADMSSMWRKAPPVLPRSDWHSVEVDQDSQVLVPPPTVRTERTVRATSSGSVALETLASLSSSPGSGLSSGWQDRSQAVDLSTTWRRSPAESPTSQWQFIGVDEDIQILVPPPPRAAVQPAASSGLVASEGPIPFSGTSDSGLSSGQKGLASTPIKASVVPSPTIQSQPEIPSRKRTRDPEESAQSQTEERPQKRRKQATRTKQTRLHTDNRADPQAHDLSTSGRTQKAEETPQLQASKPPTATTSTLFPLPVIAYSSPSTPMRTRSGVALNTAEAEDNEAPLGSEDDLFGESDTD